MLSWLFIWGIKCATISAIQLQKGLKDRRADLKEEKEIQIFKQ